MTSTNETLDMAKNSLRKRFNSNSLQQLLIFATWIVLLIGFPSPIRTSCAWAIS